jgi:hypothetical protein
MQVPVRLLGCILVAIVTVVSVRIFQRYASISLDRTFIGAMALAASMLTWMLTGLE